MSEATGTFYCPRCAASFAWKPQYAGRKTRCKCGEVFVPAEPVVQLEEELEADPYGLTEDAAPPPARRTVVVAPQPPPTSLPSHAPAAAVARAEGPHQAGVVPASVAAMYARKSSRYSSEQENSEPEEGSNFKNLYVPMVLLALGLSLRVTQLLYANANRANKWSATGDSAAHPGKAVLLVLCEMVIATAVMVCGATVAAMLLNINFGPIAKAALKLCATAVFATGVAGWVAVFDQDRHSVAGLMVALHLVVIVYWIALAYFFSLELQETMLTVAIITLLQAGGMCALWQA